jgi:hypothetical protein
MFSFYLNCTVSVLLACASIVLIALLQCLWASVVDISVAGTGVWLSCRLCGLGLEHGCWRRLDGV